MPPARRIPHEYISKKQGNQPSGEEKFDKFPDGYIIELSELEKTELVENFHRFNRHKHSTAMPKAFTEKGLYMLVAILKSPKAVETTIAIVEAYAKL